MSSTGGESETISSLVNDSQISTTSEGTQAWQITFNNPAGGTGDGTITALTFSQGAGNQITNWSSAIQAAELFEGSTALAAGTVSATSIAFTGLNVPVTDGNSKNLSLRISLKNTPGALTDNQKFVFALTSGNMTVTGNAVATPSINSDNTKNAIDVAATKLGFNPEPPSSVGVGVNFTATVQAQDENGNVDLDSTASVTISRADGTGILSGGSAQSLVNGSKTFSSLSYDTVQTFTIQATGGGLDAATSGSITAQNSVLWISSSSTAWLNTANWTGTAVPTSTQIAQFGATGTGTVGINMNTAGGNQAVGGIEITSARAANLTVGNSSATIGTLTLNGVTVNSVANAIIRNASTSNLTLQDNETGTGKMMGVALGNAIENKVLVDGTGNIIISSVISGSGKRLTLDGSGSGSLSLSGVNTYSGNTTISTGTLKLTGNGSIANSPTITDDGTFDVSGVTGGSYTLAAGQSLNGNGAVVGNLVVDATATISPGTSIGTLTFSSAPTFNGTNFMEIDRGALPNADKIVLTSGTLTFGGTLTVANIGAALENGDVFTLFENQSNPSGFSGWFSAVSLPSLPSGLAWDTNKLGTDGVLEVYSFTTNAVQTLATPKNTPTALSIAKLLAKASSSRGTPALESVANGPHGTVSVDGTDISYTPDNDYIGDDTFTCVLTDGHGWMTVTVFVTVTNPNAQGPNIISVTYDSETDTATIKFAGVPGAVFDVEETTDLSNWTTVGSNVEVDETGLGTCVRTDAPESAYYRTKYVSGP